MEINNKKNWEPRVSHRNIIQKLNEIREKQNFKGIIIRTKAASV